MNRWTTVLLSAMFAITISGCHSQAKQTEKETGVNNNLQGLELEMCIDPRPQICTMEYLPVCGYRDKGEKESYPSGCGACSNAAVIGYLPGECSE